MSLFSIAFLSGISSFTDFIEEKNHETYGKIYYIGVNNNSNPLSTIENFQTISIYTNRGDELSDEGRFEEAIPYYDKALDIDPNDIKALNSNGLALDALEK
jgi:tetratricopeptide (TPR) repeat protein